MSTSPPENRPRLRRDQRRVQLLGAALEAFSHGGYHQTLMDDIADRAGVSKPVLYQHFDGKLELYLGLLESQSEQLTLALEEALTSSDDNSERVAATVRAYFDYVNAPDGSHRLLFETDLGTDPAVQDLLDRPFRHCADAVAHLIQQDTGLPGASAQLLGVSVVGMAQACAQRWVTEGRQTTIDEAIDLVFTVAWRGLGGLPLIRAENPDD